MTPLNILYQKSEVNYYRLGYGRKPAFCFHGYGESASSFSFLETHAGQYYTLYVIDLPFHGLTEWKDGLNFTVEDLRKIVKEILDKHNPEIKKTDEEINQQGLTLIGFSLGARICLSLYETMPQQIEKMILLGPDGLKVNFWYWLSTQTRMGNKFFSYTMQHPQWFFGFLKALNKLSLINTSIFKFVKIYIEDCEVRQLLYLRWTCLRKVKPAIRKIKRLVNKNKTAVRLIYGKHDRMMLVKRGEKFRNGIEDHCIITVINSGHQVLHEKHVNQILPSLLH